MSFFAGLVALIPSKVQAILKWPIPKNIKGLHILLCLLGFYCNFFCNYAVIALLLTTLFKKDNFGWSLEAQTSFEALKFALPNALILASELFHFLPWAEYHYNTYVHFVIGFSPFQVIYGKPPPSILAYIAGSSFVAACDSTLTSRNEKVYTHLHQFS